MKFGTVGKIVMIFFILLGAAIFVYGVFAKEGMPVNLMQVYIGAFAGVYTVYSTNESWQRNTRSKYYRPEMDDKRPEVQQAAIKRMLNGQGDSK